MYESFFGFRAKPFKDQPELRFHYVTPAYAENFNALRKSIRQQHGLHLLTGASGCGKSLFLQRLMAASKNQNIFYARSTDAAASLTDFVDDICDQLDLLGSGQPVAEKLQWIQASAVERREQGKLLVLAIDDAHKLHDDVLRELLTFFCNSEDRALQLLLLGLPELEARVVGVCDDLAVDEVLRRYELGPLDASDIENYIMQQLRAAGYHGNAIFLPEAVRRLEHYANGTLRELSLLCDLALVIAHLNSAQQVDAEIVEEAANQQNVDKQAAAPDTAPAADANDDSDPADADAEAFLKRIAEEQEAQQDGRPNPRYQKTAAAPDVGEAGGEALFVKDAAVGASKDGVLMRHLPVAAGLALILCTGIVATVFMLRQDATPPAVVAVPEPVSASVEAIVAAAPATTPIPAATTATPPTEPPAATSAAPPVATTATPPTEPPAAAAATTPADTGATDRTAGRVTAATTATPAGATPDVATPPAAPLTAAVETPAPPVDAEPAPPVGAESTTAPAPAPAFVVDVPDSKTSDNAHIRTMLRLAGAQVRAENLVEPQGNNALETFLELLQQEPDNAEALRGVRQISEYYFREVETARQTRELLLQQAEAARRQQQDYLNRFAIAKQEKEAYLRDINAYYIGQAILANRYKVDSLIQAETAQQHTEKYLVSLTGELQAVNPRPPRDRNGVLSGNELLTPEQAVLAETRVDRLLIRARQQIDENRLIKPKRNSALSTYRQVLELSPGHPDALAGLEHIMDQYLNWAAAEAARGNPQRAKYYFDQAMEVAPDSINLAQKIRNVRQQVTVLENASTSIAAQETSTPRNLNSSPQLAEALLYSARLGDDSSVAMLLSSGADVNAADLRGNTALMLAAQYGHGDVVSTLLARGAKIDRDNGFGETALMFAAAQGRDGVVKILLAAGASPHSRDADGRTPLINAAAAGHDTVVQRLLASDADVAVRSKAGRTSLMAAAWGGHGELVSALLSAGADPNTTNNDGWTALSHAAWQGHADVVRRLLERGASSAIRNNDGQTALTMASSRGHNDVVSLLQ